ncbi:hypothetical protein BCR37DRAFT_385449 [Protomyces lactucae-debilis]|uniref:Zn(2)-C6 fungal-type domain-containing protein n=1 Tax=Protomyces lactucae-debilis TaxID=2754530 RepID=A0A1Y2FSN2_PROLT|nr:uncharacterized protein BCR37DRAFT_385449 [Protomyces lactucae-debilis]ORY87012.1 hypothetical protein BCR37DRAFT_385449 [Protomyces lactucae-debilis]
MTSQAHDAASAQARRQNQANDATRNPPAGTRFISSCVRCRRRKIKCDAGLPSCHACKDAGVDCMFHDAEAGTEVKRDFILGLEDHLTHLMHDHGIQVNTAESRRQVRKEAPNVLESETDSSVGFSSGYPILRSLLANADLPAATPWPHMTYDNWLRQLASRPQTATLPMPTKKTMATICAIYNKVFEPLYPVYTWPEIRTMLNEVYLNGQVTRRDISDHTLFCFPIIYAHGVDLANRVDNSVESIFVQALTFSKLGYPQLLQNPDIRSLKSLIFMNMSAHAKELPTPLWHGSGMAMRTCYDLGFHLATTGQASQANEVVDEQTKRRLFWLIYCMDRGLCMLLGRPPSYQVVPITRPYPEGVSQQFLARIKIRQIQSEIMHRQALSKNAAGSESDAEKMEDKLHNWVSQTSTLEEQVQYCNTVLLLYRPDIMRGSQRACLRSLECCLQSLEVYKTQACEFAVVEGTLVTHMLFVNVITLLYLYRESAEVRQRLPYQALEQRIREIRLVFRALGRRWSVSRDNLKLVDAIFERLR